MKLFIPAYSPSVNIQWVFRSVDTNKGHTKVKVMDVRMLTDVGGTMLRAFSPHKLEYGVNLIAPCKAVNISPVAPQQEEGAIPAFHANYCEKHTNKEI